MLGLLSTYTRVLREIGSLLFHYIFLTSVVLVLNKMLLVLVFESLVAIEHEHEHLRSTEHEHEFTDKSVKNLESRADMWVTDEDDKSSQYRRY